MTTARSITIANRHPRLRFPRADVVAAVGVLDRHADQFGGGCPPGELSLAFLTDSALAKLHADFLDDPTITDVITFEGNSAFGMAGEICISADAAAREAGKARDAFARELLLYVVHGWLHLAGFDDLEPAKKRVMRRAEAKAMKLLDQAAARPDFRLIK